jgi:hypothetical protein
MTYLALCGDPSRPATAEPDASDLDEPGTSLRAAGWHVLAERPAQPGWDQPSRPRLARGTEGIPRTLWEAAP